MMRPDAEAHMTTFTDISWMRLPLPESEPGALFGAAVAVCRGTVVVGAPSKDREGSLSVAADAGRAYIFEWDGAHWGPTAVLDGHDPRGSLFGAAVAIDGRRVVVGAPRARVHGTPHAGHAIVFVRADGRWERSARLVDPHGPEPEDAFGAAVAVHGDSIVVGAPLEISGSGPPGVVHSFRHVGQGPWTALTPAGARWRPGPDADPPPSDLPGSLFGRHLDHRGHYLAVSQDRWGDGPALAAIFESRQGDWVQTDILRPPAGVSGPGAGIAMDGELLAVGVPTSAADGLASAGVVCLFEREGGHYQHRATLRAPTPAVGAAFGADVAVSGSTVVVGAPGLSADGHDQVGAVYIYERSEDLRWGCVQRFLPPSDDDRQARARLGEAVAIHGRTIVAGAPGADAEHGGAVYVIEAT